MHRITFTRPAATMSVSVTGRACGLECAHCGAKYLKGMRPPDEALAAFPDAHAKSVLMSGGSDASGRVPVEGWAEKFKEKAPYLRVNCHTGIMDEEKAATLAGAVDVISFDYVSDERIVKGVYGSSSSPEDYVRSFITASNCAPTVPHITVGLLGPDEEPSFSIKSLEEIRNLADAGVIPEPPSVVIIAFKPTPGTRMQDVPPPKAASVAEVIMVAKKLLPKSPVCLGCMRPSGQYRDDLDLLAVEAKVDVIVMPSRVAAERALELGYEIAYDDECCAFSALEGGEPEDGLRWQEAHV